MVESLPNKDTLLGELASFLDRGSRPLSALCTNHSVSTIKHQRHHPLEYARRIVDSPTDPELVTLAYKCLYSGASGVVETGELLKSHQHYIIQLTSTKNWRQAYVELSTLHGVFSGSKKYSRVLWLTLLEGVETSSSFCASLVVSYHFLILQTVLQAVSNNLQTVAKGHGELNCSLFQSVAEMFLAGSNLLNWMHMLNSDNLALKKYYNNCVKILGGFVKVGKFLRQKDDSIAPVLDLSLLLLEMKLFEFSIKVGGDVSEPVLPPKSSISTPFIKDLLDTLSELRVNCFLELAAKLSSYHEDVSSKLKIGQAGIGQLGDMDMLSTIKSATSNCAINDSKLSDLMEFVKNSDPASLYLPMHLKILDLVEANLGLLEKLSLNSLIDMYLLKAQLSSQKSTDFDRLLAAFIPRLIELIIKLGQTKPLKVLEALCYNHFKNTSLVESLTKTIEIQLHYSGIVTLSPELNKIKLRIERCLDSLASSVSSVHNLATTKLAHSYICSFQETIGSNYSKRLMKHLAPFFLLQPTLVGRLWFGKLLGLNSDQKASLFCSLLDELVGKIPIRSPVIMDLACTLQINHEGQLLCLHYAALAFNIGFDIKEIRAMSTVDYLYLAEIRVQLLSSSEADCGALLRDICSDVSSWVQLTKGDTPNDQQVAVLRILNEIHNLGYFGLTVELVKSIKESRVLRSNQTRLHLDFILTECYLKLSKYSEIPNELHEAGDIMKSMHLEGSSVDCNLLIRWKLIQLEYFIRMQDESKISSKFQDIEKLMLRFPEYNLKADSTNLPLKRRLECLLLLARFLNLTSHFNADAGSYVLAFKNLKLSIKLLNSIIRKLETSSQTLILKAQAEELLLSSYSLAYGFCRHLGLLKDAMFYLAELEKLNDVVQNPIFNCFYHLQIATFYACVGKESESSSHLDKGRIIADRTGMNVLNCLTLNAEIIFKALFMPNYESFNKDVQRMQHFVAELDSFSQTYEGLAGVYLLESSSELEYIMCMKNGGPLPSKDDGTVLHKRQMLLKAMAVVSSSIHEVNTFMKQEYDDSFDKEIKLLPHYASLEIDQARDDMQRKLFDCKEILQNCLKKDHSTHLEVRKMKQINALFNRCVFLLSFVAVLKAEGVENLLSTVYFLLDLPKNLPLMNQQRVIETLGIKSGNVNELLPTLNDNQNFILYGTGSIFVQNLKNLLPLKWVVVTIDICPISGVILFSRFTGRDEFPLFFKIPLKGKLISSSFKDIILRLKKIIDDSNLSTTYNVTSRVKTKEDRKSWWKFRFDLDLQLGYLLDDVEKNIIGSFNGIFERPDRDSVDYKKFAARLSEVWEVFLKKRTKAVSICESTVDLYYCAKPFDRNGTFDPCLVEDLVMYTIDEICGSRESKSKDSSALAGIYHQLEELYHSLDPSPMNCEHLVLVPSTACCSFPWESLGILQNRSISRVPSVGLLASLLEKHSPSPTISKEISAKGIFYLVNPGNDLKRTQERFEPALKSIPHARGLCGELPKEDYLLSNLFDSGLYLYLGHGGGEQYVRTSSLLKARFEDSVKHLPPAILMGCSSGAYQDNGDLEPTSNVFNWLVCGSSMVISNLWDITDKDIDNFSHSVFSKWGFLPGNQLRTDKVNISQAVATSRTACTLKYLNGAAPIVHGLPLNFH